jgi:hypothetical protein
MRHPRIAIITAIAEELAAAREFLDCQDRTDPTDGSVYFHATFRPKERRLQCFPADLNLGDSQRVSHGRVCSH